METLLIMIAVIFYGIYAVKITINVIAYILGTIVYFIRGY